MAIILAVGLAAYAGCLGGDFVYDDLHSVRDNPALRSLANIPRFFVDVGLFSSLDCRLYRPVLLASFAVDAAVGGMAAWVFKLTNLLLHLSAALLLFGVARALRMDRTRALLGACLLVAHPLASEAVNTISGRSNLMMVVALLAGVRCYLWAMRGRRLATLATLLCGAVAVGCKEPGMILPVLLIVLEGLRWRRRPLARRSWGGVALRILPVVALVIGYVVVRGHLLGAASFGVNEWQGTGTLHSGHHRGMATQLATMALLLPGALAQFILPHGLTMDPVIQYIDDWTAPAVWAGVVLMVVLTALGLASPRRHPTRFLGTCLAWGCALPWVVKPLNLPFLEHRLYGSLAGLAMVVSTLLPRIDRRALWARPARAHLVAPRLALVAVVAVVAVVAAFAAISARRSAEFATAETLWSLELQRNPDSKVAMAGMAVCRMRQQRFADARVYLRQLIVAYPERADARVNLAECELQSGVDGDPGVAVEQARHLAAQDPRNPFHRLLLSRALAAVGVRRGGAERFDEAVAAALSCLEIAAPKGLVYRTAASARRLQGDLDAAIELLDRSVARGLAHSSVLLDRAQLLMARGRWSQARRDLAAARQQDPFNPAVIAAFDQLVNRPAVQPPR